MTIFRISIPVEHDQHAWGRVPAERGGPFRDGVDFREGEILEHHRSMYLGGDGRRDGLDQVVESERDARVVWGFLDEALEVGPIAVRDNVVLGDGRCERGYWFMYQGG